MGLLRKDTSYFGLDIGTSAIRLVQLRHGGAKPVLVTYGDVAVAPGITTSDSDMDRAKVAEVIKKLVHDAKVSTNNVVAGLPSANIFASVITTPHLTDAELAKAIKFQADQYIPMALDQVKLDWQVLGPGKTDNEMEVLLVAAPITVTTKYLDMFEKAGLEVLALEVNAAAVARALVPPSSLAILILDTGSLTSDITIVYDNAPRVMRSVPVGGATFVKSVAQNLGLDEAQAEQFTYKFGLTQTKLEAQVVRAIKPSLDQLLAEVDKSVKFFMGRYQDVKLEKLVLTGSTVALPEMTTYLATATGLPVEIGNPWVNIAYPANLQDQLMSVAGNYAVAAGLAERMYV